MKKKKVHCQYFTSAFLGHCTADKLKKALMTEIQELNPKNLIQISMDGPNVNIAPSKKVFLTTVFFHKFSKHLMQKRTHTTFLLILKKKDEHEALVTCARS